MARQGNRGSSIVLQVQFFEDNTLYDPISVSGIDIYDARVDGNLVTQVTGARVSLGTWQGTWVVPGDQILGNYYDEWRWTSASGEFEVLDRSEFTIASLRTFHASGRTVTEESRLQAIETMMNTLQTAMNNVATKRDLRAFVATLQQQINTLDEDLDQHKVEGH